MMMKLFTSFLVVVGTWTTATAFSARRTTRSSRRTNRPLLMAASSSSSAASSRREVLTTTGGAAAAAIASGLGVLTPAVASAASITKQSAANRANESYQGVYFDPKHPEGYRVIMAKADGKSALMTLSDGIPADPNQQETTYTNQPVKVDGTQVTIDFSFKGGPKDIVGTIADDQQSITFADGNTWIKNKQKYDGIYKDPTYPLGYRIVRKQKGTYMSVEINNTGNPKDSQFIRGRVGSLYAIPTVDLTFEYPNVGDVVGKLCLLDRNTVWSYGTITFPGNVVTQPLSWEDSQQGRAPRQVYTPADVSGAVWTRI